MTVTGQPAVGEPIDLTELLASAHPELTLVQLLGATVAHGRVVEVGRLTDEERVALTGDYDPEVAPWLSTLDEDSRRVSVSEARRNLMAEEVASFTDEGELVEVAPALAAWLWADANFDMISVVDTHVGGELEGGVEGDVVQVVARSVFKRVHPQLLLLEVVTAAGFHELSFCGRESAARWLGHHSGVAAGDVEEAVIPLGSIEEAADLTRRLAAQCSSHTTIYTRELVGEEGETDRELTIYAGPQATTLVEFLPTEEGGQMLAARTIGFDSLVDYLDDYLAPVITNG